MVETVFYCFSTLLLISSVMVIALSNPVHSVLCLIFAFFNAAALFILIGAEYIAMTLIIVYVGAVAVLFLFVVMMLGADLKRVKKGLLDYLPIALFLGGLVFFEINWAFNQSELYLGNNSKNFFDPNLTNTSAIGQKLYTEYFLQFQLSGIILLVAIIGAIILTLRHDKQVKRQNIYKQISRTRKESIELVNPESGKGVKIS